MRDQQRLQHYQHIVESTTSIVGLVDASYVYQYVNDAYCTAFQKSRQVGRFEVADGSTLFLDEIGEMPLELQAKLLRVLQEGQFERLGNPETIRTDVRIIASTNRNFAKAVQEDRFREDLYYRLNLFFMIAAPPLRERIEDLPLLVWTFVKELENTMGKTIHRISKKSFDSLKHYAWPGNIRELKNVVESAMIVNQGKTLKIVPPA